MAAYIGYCFGHNCRCFVVLDNIHHCYTAALDSSCRCSIEVDRSRRYCMKDNNPIDIHTADHIDPQIIAKMNLLPVEKVFFIFSPLFICLIRNQSPEEIKCIFLRFSRASNLKVIFKIFYVYINRKMFFLLSNSAI